MYVSHHGIAKEREGICIRAQYDIATTTDDVGTAAL